jgi:hypothetical protein
MASNSVYKLFKRLTTSIGVLLAHIEVKPTMSEKYKETSSKCSAFIGRPIFSSSATVLKRHNDFFPD